MFPNSSQNSLSSILKQQNRRLLQLAKDTRSLLLQVDHTLPAHVFLEFESLEQGYTKVVTQIEQIEHRQDNLLALIRIGQVVNSSLEPGEVLRIVMDTIIRLLKAERGFLMLKNDLDELNIRIARNWEQESINPSEFAISRTVINRVIAENKPVLTTNAQEDPRFGGHQSIVAYNLRSILCVPLMVKDKLTGVIYADNRIRTGIFSEQERDLLAAFANQAAVAIENARLFESLRSTLDEVTELKNLMDNVFASIASGVITADRNGRVTLCNHAAEDILGLSSNQLIGNPLNQVLPRFSDHIAGHVGKVLKTNQKVVGLEFDTRLEARGELSLNLNLSPLVDADKNTQGIAIVVDDLTEKKRLEAQRRLFEKMVSPAVIEQLDPDEIKMGGQRCEITTLFADIRGFTSYSEKIPPEELVGILNRYLGAAAEAVLAHAGTIDKFLGDAVMAWFNAPIPQKDHTLRAVHAAIDMRRAIHFLHKSLPPAFHLSFGAGIHFGEAVLGLVGTSERLDYTAIGDSVNTAKRIQENAEAEQILISADAFKLISNQVNVRPVNPIHAKGKRQPVEVYEVLSLKL